MRVIMDRLLSTSKCVMLIISQLKSARNYLFGGSFYADKIQLPEIIVDYGGHGLKYYEKKNSASGEEIDDHAECSICLCTFEEGDEVRELNCSHIFHKVCLDRWLGHGRLTCPLCRGHLRLRLPASWSSSAVNSNGSENLFFNFCDVSSGGRDKWWLR